MGPKRARGRRVELARAARVLLLAVLALRSAGAGPEPGEKEFLAALDRARARLAAGDGAGGKRVLDEALAQHEMRDYARAKRVELEDLVRRLAFRQACPPPDPAGLVRGKLAKYVSKTGEVELRYAAGAPHDFEPAPEGKLVFPTPFVGPFSVVVRGTSYPTSSAAAPRIVVGLERDPKSERTHSWGVSPTKLVHHDGDDHRSLAGKETPVTRPGRPWRLEVKVGKARIEAAFDGKSIGAGAKPESVFGRLVVDREGWSEIVVAGLVEPSWIQTKIDAVVEEKRGAFEGEFDVREHLPEWVFEEAAVEWTGAAHDEDRAPLVLAEVPEDLRDEVDLLNARFGKDDRAESLAAIESLRGRRAPESVLRMLESHLHLAFGESAQAVAASNRWLAAAPASIGPQVLRAVAFSRLGRHDDAVVAWRAVAAGARGDLPLLEAACLGLLSGGRLDEARAVAEGLLRAGRRTERMEALQRLLVQATRGPLWPKSFEHKSANYHVVSDIDAETCRRAAEVLEESLTVYRADVKPMKSAARLLYRVYLFSGQAGYLRYLAEVKMFGGTPEHTAGMYSPLLKQLLIWNLPSRDEMMRTVRHEGFHQYLDRLLPDPPRWFDEGMAVYYEGMERVEGKMQIGGVRRDDVALLRQQPPAPLSTYLLEGPEAFYERGYHSYAQAWALVHMLRHGTPKHRALYESLLARLATESGAEAVRAVFDEATVRALEEDLAAYVETLSKSR